MLVALRIALYVQFLLGAGRLLGWVANQRLWETHISVGVLAAIIALFALRPLPNVENNALRIAARFAPAVVLIYGFLMYWDVLVGRPATMFHALLGVIAIGLVEAAAARQKRAQKS